MYDVLIGEPWLAKKVRILGDRYEDDESENEDNNEGEKWHENRHENGSSVEGGNEGFRTRQGVQATDGQHLAENTSKHHKEKHTTTVTTKAKRRKGSYWPIWDLRCFIVKV
jgi:hypothetical protein